MKKFFKYLLATLVGSTLGIVIAFVISLIIMMGVIASFGDLSQQKVTVVKSNSVMKIRFKSDIVDRTSKNPMENFNFQTMQPEPKIGLNDILNNLNKAKDDERIKGIYMELDAIPAGIGTIQEIHEALIDFKESGKFIICYSDFYTQGAYYLASLADKVYLNPAGLVEFKGLGAELMFFKGALEKLGIAPQIIRHGKFKSAIEPLILEKMSEANREQTMTYLQSIWDKLVVDISNQRGISIEDLNMYADSMKITNAEDALQYKLIDGLKYKDEIIAELKELTGTKESKKDVNYVGLGAYTNAKDPKDKKKEKPSKKEKIAVIYASGDIVMGEGSESQIGSDGISKAIREARLDSTIKAVVLRVNSPGGSALASEVIWREMDLCKAEKPVIVSMGDVAASGGYYIAAPADVIVANENTITGSIGVFGVLWDGSELLTDKLGVTIDVVKTNAHSDIGSVFRQMTNAERHVIQNSVEEIYDVFITHVAEGRKMEKAEVDSIGQGRVWSGTNAKEIGLIDEFGGLTKAINIAKEKAGLEEFKLVELPEQDDPFEAIMKEIMGDKEASFVKKQLGADYKYIEYFHHALQFRGIQARLPYDVDIY